MSIQRNQFIPLVALGATIAACSEPASVGLNSWGGQTNTGGVSIGGNRNTGGQVSAGGTGGIATTSTGDVVSTGGSAQTNSSLATGGNLSAGGATANGGQSASSTTVGTSSSIATGGASAGGISGVSTTGGRTATVTGGATAVSTVQGGQGTGGTSAAGGGGQSSTGGQSTTGASTSWAPSATCVQQASDLVGKLSLAQRIGQMTMVDSAGLSTSEANTAFLGAVLSGGTSDPSGGNSIASWSAQIASYLNVAKAFSPHAGLLYGLDSVHGNNNIINAVIFPHNIGLGASRNAKLVEDVTRITALEMLGVGANWAFAPTVAAALDIRWGRTYETFSETPDLAGELGAATVRGLQNGTLSKGQSVLACAKHYAGDGASDNGVNAGDCTKLDEATFRKLAIEPYRPAIAAGVGSIMVSYGSYQGAKMTGSKKWITDVLKGELGFQGFVVSDWDAVARMSSDSFSTQLQTAFNAGLDMIMLSHGMDAHSAAEVSSTLTSLVNAGSVAPDRVNDAARRILTIKCEMGLLDGDTTIDASLTNAIGSTEHRAVARDAVRQSLVLLKNDGVLPLSNSLSRIHVTGSGADSLAKQCGGWTVGWQGLDSSSGMTTGTTVLAAIKKRFSGTSTAITSSADGSGASGAARAIVVVGESPYAEQYGDTTNPTLSAADFAAIAAVKAANVPFVVVLFSGRPLILTDSGGTSAIDQANGFVAAWLPGTEGDGIVDVLFGDFKPTGKLSFTWPASLAQIPSNPGDGKAPQFPFGYGLTY